MTASRHLDWPGMYGVRDLGGLPTATGDTTRFGSLVRSEGLDRLEPSGWRDLYRYGIRTCIDLRSGFEVEARPYEVDVAGVVRISSPWEEGLLADEVFAGWATSGVLGSALYFERFLDRCPDRTADVLRAVADAGPGGVLFHCQRGRERTGLLAMVLLSLAGVPVDVIVADHLRTDELLRTRGIALGHVSLEGEAELYAARGTDAEATLTALLADFDVADYLRNAGMSAVELARLRSRLVDG